MSARAVDFERLLQPLDSATFFREHWEQRRLVLARNDPSYYAGLFAAGDVDALIYFGRTRFLDAERSLQGASSTVLRGLPQEGEPPGASGGLGLLELRKLHAEKKTVLVHSLQLRVPAVAALARSLEAALHYPVNVNMYLTPAGAQGFGPHFDDHDVFIMQLEGYKHWRLYPPTRELPLKFEEPMVPRERLTGPVEEVRMEPGDLLYLPRGFVHEAFTSEQASLHLTVGVEVFRWADLLASALACASRDTLGLREAVPPGWVGLAAPTDAMRERFRQLLRQLAEEARLDDALAHLGEQFVAQLPALPDGRFAEPLDPERIELDTSLEKRPGTICHIVDEGDTVSARFPGSSIRGPRSIAPALRFVAAAPGPFTARALPDDLSDRSKLILLRRLVREGLVTPTTPAERP